MEKIKEIISEFEMALHQKIEIEILETYKTNLNSLVESFNHISEKKKGITEQMEGKFTGISFEEFVKNTDTEIGGVTEKFAKVIDLTKKLETDTAIKQFLGQKINDIFQVITEGANRTFNLSALEIFDEMMGDLRGDMEQKLISGIEKELFSVKTSFGEFEKVYEVMEQQFSGINQAMTGMKENYQNLVKLLTMTSEIIGKDFVKITDAFKILNKDFDNIQQEIETKLTSATQKYSELMENLKSGIESYLESEKQSSGEEKEQLLKENQTLKLELEGVKHFLEKSPKYQLLYLISNLEETSFKKIKELTKFDDGILNLSLEELKEKDLITISGEEDPTVQVKKKLNPLSCIELTKVFNSELVTNFKHYSDPSSFEEGFNKILAEIEKYTEKHPEEAGYLVSILYLYIYESGNFHFFDKIRKYYLDLRKNSYYLRLIENTINTRVWESKKRAEVEGLSKPAELVVFNKDLEMFNEVSEIDVGNAPFQIDKYKPISILNWDNDIPVAKSTLNRFSSVSELIRWVWLNGQGTNFAIEFVDSQGEKHQIMISDSKKIEAQLFLKKHEVFVD